ncbi:DNA-binding protein [Paenibacillus sp. FSL R7-0179]|uniref:DNA-binding protein n=1 Tax=Paenibacillus sp. FSL R7-0179 TaxID=2921672 RepID=UPI0030F4D7CA
MRPSILKLLNPDIIVEMLEMANRLEDWNKVLNTAGILHSYAQCIYEERQYHKAKGLPVPLMDMQRPLVYYFGFSHLMRGIAYQKQQKYDEAREMIYRYAELGWMEDLGVEGETIAEEFRGLARANLYMVDILSGKNGLLEEYRCFLQDHPEELLPGLGTILQAAVDYGLDVDDLLHTFAEQSAGFGDYEDAGNLSYYLNYCYHLALYHKRGGRLPEAMDWMMQALRLAHQSRHDSNFKRCLASFEALRGKVTAEESRRYDEVLADCLAQVVLGLHEPPDAGVQIRIFS